MNHILISMLILLSILGIFVSSYISSSRYRKKPLVCTINGDCNEVLESKWSRIFYVKNDIIGIIYYLFILIGALYLIFFSRNILLYMEMISGAALLFSLILLLLQARVIKKYCFYCIVSCIINLYIYLDIITLIGRQVYIS